MAPDRGGHSAPSVAGLVSTRARPRLLASALAAGGAILAGGKPLAAQPQPPDVILIVTDDMRDPDWQALPQTRQTLGERGTTFPNFTCAAPLCSPSRVSMLTGRYSHNHGVLGNSGQTGGWSRFAELGLGSATIQRPLHEAGYRTGMVGKFLNGAPASGEVPPDWDTWYCQTDFQYLGPEINDNGRRRKLGPRKYSTDVLRDRAVDFVRSTPRQQPLFLLFSPIAPHNQAIPPTRHDNAFKRTQLEDSPAINETNVSDKPRYLRSLPPLNRRLRDELGQLNRNRLRTLLAVDDAISAVWSALQSTRRADEAYVFVLSDHGFLLGHHRYVGKTAPHDAAARVRMIASGPEFAAGAVDHRLASMVDLAPTIADVAGVAAPGGDGISLLRSDRREETLLEWLGGNEPQARLVADHSPSYAALRAPRHLYVEYETGEREMYDYASDPDELENLLADWEGHAPTTNAEALATTFAARLNDLRDCAGAACR